MNKIVKSFFLFCIFVTTTDLSFSEEDVTRSQADEHDIEQANPGETGTQEVLNESKDHPEGRSIADAAGANNYENVEKHSKPLRSIFLGIYKNYKSTYLGNKTLSEYKQTLRDNMKYREQQQHHQQLDASPEDNGTDEDGEADGIVTAYSDHEEIEHIETTTTILPQPPSMAQNKTKLSLNKKKKLSANQGKSTLQQYNVGPALNLSLDMDNTIVKVNLDGESLRELVTGRWFNDNTEEGRGKKYEMVTRILPLFILPFLIQSAIVPFLVTKLKLLLMKSILVGKLAIFLLIISAFRNSNKQMQTYEVPPTYWAGEPSRRSELAAAASNMAYNGYRVEGKPAAWIN